jgi:hypothetical protein
MPAKALDHFTADVARARELIAHAESIPLVDPVSRLLRADILRSAWIFAVGSLDAYFSDAYTDVVAAVIISKSRYAPMVLPDFFYEIKFPVRAVLETYAANTNWRWRMAARRMMDRESVLKLVTIQHLFNKFFPNGRRLFGDVLENWIIHPDAKKRLFGITRLAYLSLPDATAKQTARRLARDQMEERFGAIFQRRHDCVHNCDRPRSAPQSLVLGSTVRKVIQDVEFLVHRCDEHIQGEAHEFLLRCGCTSAIALQSGY